LDEIIKKNNINNNNKGTGCGVKAQTSFFNFPYFLINTHFIQPHFIYGRLSRAWMKKWEAFKGLDETDLDEVDLDEVGPG
jgi:hypothetical protein